MIKCEKVFVNQLIERNIVNFYIRYVNDVLVVVRKKGIDIVSKNFNRVNKKSKFAINTFQNCVPHFLDIKISPIELDIYHKNTQTGQYTYIEYIEHFTLWK